MSNTTANATAPNTTETAKEVSFGAGRYSAIMKSCYDECQSLFGIPADKAEKIARDLGSDVGTILNNVPTEIRISKISKDGKVSMADVSKIKGVTVTYPIAIARAIQWIGDAGKNGVSYGHSKWKLTQNLQDWVNGLKV
jgi:hypothetical protein